MRNYSLDSFRLFFAFFIVALHIPFVGNSNLGNLGWESFQFIGHLGVPFFFVVSGFFAYSSDLKKQSVRLGNQFKKILGLFVASYFLFVAYSMVIEQSFFQKISTFTPQNIFNNLIHGWPTFDPILWFLVAQLYIIGLRWLFIKIAILFKAKRSVFIDWVFLLSGIVGYGLCCLNQTYFPLLGAQTAAKLSDYLNFFTDGLVFYMVGYFVRKIDSKNPIQKVHAFVVWIVFIVSFFLLVGEYLLSKNILIANHQTFFPAFNMMQIIFAFALLVLLVKYPNIGKFNNSFLGCLISRLGAKVAVYIYIIHEMVYYILLYMIYPSIWGHKLKVDSFDKYFGICFITFLVALIVGAIYAYIKDEIKIAQKFTIENKSQVKTKVVRNNSMDIMRMVAAFLIVIIHAAANYTTKGYRTEFSIVQVLRLLAPVAVVYFFALAGYFIYSSSWQVVVNKTVKQIKKIAILFACALFVWYWFGQFAVYVLKINNIYFVNIFTVQNWDYYRLTNLFLYGDTPFWGGLWFFQAYIYGLIIMLILAVVFKNKLFKKRAMVFLMAVMFCLFSYCSIYMAYYKTCVLGENILSVWYRNWLFFGLPFIFVGFFVARFRSKLVQIPGKIIIPLSVVLFVLLYFENWISRLKLGASTDDSAHDMDFILIFLVPVLLILFCKFPLDKIKILNTKLFRYASASSLYVYIYHLMIIYILISKKIFNHFEMYFGLLITVGIYVFITLLGVVYLELKSGIKLFINHKNFQ